jgi:hypothetical protein
MAKLQLLDNSNEKTTMGFENIGELLRQMSPGQEPDRLLKRVLPSIFLLILPVNG